MNILGFEHRDLESNSERYSGKTFRRLMESLLQASAGNHVYYIVNNEQMRRWTFNKVMDVIKAYFGDRIEYNGHAWEHFEIKFPQGGFVRIMSENGWNRNPVPSDVMPNHVVIEMDDTHE